MRIYTIKHKGATIWHNMYFYKQMSIENKNINIGLLFFRRKDAKLFLDSLPYKDYYEIVGASIDKKN